MTQLKSPSRYPVNVLTGFLGSGKTTLLRRLLQSDAMAHCAVLINEFGSVGLDHLLLEHTEHEQDQEMVLLPNGCVCCAIRGDFEQALLRLLERRSGQSALPAFDRVLIETTGVADPAPVINTILMSPVLQHHFRVGTLVTVVDALHGEQHLREQDVSRKQVAVADRLVISKADIVPDHQVAQLEAQLQAINSIAPIVRSYDDADEEVLKVSRDVMLDGEREVLSWFGKSAGGVLRGARLRAQDDDVRVEEAVGNMAGQPFSGNTTMRTNHYVDIAAVGTHERTYSTVSLTCAAPLDWIAFGVWLSMFLHRYGPQILRVKGLLNIEGSETPIVVHGVHATIYPPSHLKAWPSGERNTRLVLIGDLPPANRIVESLNAFSVSEGEFQIAR